MTKMKFTIGTVSNSLNLEEDLRLIKSSILYADEIELIGMVEYALYKYLPANVFGAKDLDSMIPALKMFLQSVQPEGCASIMKQLEDAEQQLRFYAPALKKKNRRSTQEILAQYKIKTLEKQLQEQLESGMDQLLTTPESRKIKNLIDRNIVSVYDYGFKNLM